MKAHGLCYAIVGATGAVGTSLISILEERALPVTRLCLLASQRSVDRQLFFQGQPIGVEDVAEFDFSQTDIVFFSAGAAVSASYVPQAVAAGAVVIDNTSCFRYQDDVPLVIPEVNIDSLASYRPKNIIANPNCSTAGMLVALKPIHDAVCIQHINVATYQSVSGAGARAIKELAAQSACVLQEGIEHRLEDSKLQELQQVHPKQIAFNVLPHIDKFQDNGFTREEMKMIWETHKILDADIEVNPTCVRVPVFCAHSAAVHLKTQTAISRDEAIRLLKQAPGIKVLDAWQDGGYPTAVTEAAGSDAVYVGRIRESLIGTGLNLWVVADNLRKGAALNSIQIAEAIAADLSTAKP